MVQGLDYSALDPERESPTEARLGAPLDHARSSFSDLVRVANIQECHSGLADLQESLMRGWHVTTLYKKGRKVFLKLYQCNCVS